MKNAEIIADKLNGGIASKKLRDETEGPAKEAEAKCNELHANGSFRNPKIMKKFHRYYSDVWQKYDKACEAHNCVMNGIILNDIAILPIYYNNIVGYLRYLTCGDDISKREANLFKDFNGKHKMTLTYIIDGKKKTKTISQKKNWTQKEMIEMAKKFVSYQMNIEDFTKN